MARVLHTESSTGWGGQEMRILLETRVMSGRGHFVMIAAQAGSRILSAAEKEGIATASVSLKGPADLAGIRSVISVCRSAGIDIVNTHSSGDSWTAGFATRLAGRKLIRTRHLSIPVSRTPGARILYGLLPHAVVTTGQALADQLITSGLVRAHRAHSIPTGIDLDRFRFSADGRSELRRELGIAEGAVLVGTVAMFRRMKGYNVLLDAANEVTRKHDNVFFVLVGDSPPGSTHKGEIETRASALGLAERVRFAGYRDDIPRLLSAMDVFVLASIENEGVPQGISQAMASGRPVVATRVGAVAEQVVDGQTGLLVDPADPAALASAILTLVRSPEEREQMGDKGRERAVRILSVEAMALATEQLYDDLLQREGR